MKSRLLITIGLVFLMLFTVSAIDGNASERPRFIKIGASTIGGTFFPICAATAEVLNRNIDGTIFTVTTGGGIINVNKMEAGEMLMAIIPGSSTYAGYAPLEPFTKRAQKQRTIGVFYTFPYHLIVRADSDIVHIKDLKDKRLGVGRRGWSAEAVIRALLETQGITYDSIRASGGQTTMADWAQMRGMFQDRRLDFTMDASPVPSPGITEITTMAPIRLLNVTPDMVEKVRAENAGFYTVKIPGGTYRGQESDVIQMGDPAVMVLSIDVPEDLGYEITKGIFDNVPEIAQVHSALREMAMEKALDGAFIPLHPGAYRYFKEKGLTIPEHLKPRAEL